MVVYPKKMLSNLNITKGLIFFSGSNARINKIRNHKRKKHIGLFQKTRQTKFFQENIDLIELIKKDKLINSKIPISKMKNIFNYSKHFKHVNYIFRRVF